MGSRLSSQAASNSNTDNNVRPLRVTSTSSTGSAQADEVQGFHETSFKSPAREMPTRRKNVKGVIGGGGHHDNSLQVQLSNNHIFQRQQQRLHSQSVDLNEVMYIM